MQTQVGVNQEWFYRDDLKRQAIREKYNLGDAFVFGSATRFTPDKGLDDIIDALPDDGNWNNISNLYIKSLNNLYNFSRNKKKN